MDDSEHVSVAAGYALHNPKHTGHCSRGSRDWSCFRVSIQQGVLFVCTVNYDTSRVFIEQTFECGYCTKGYV